MTTMLPILINRRSARMVAQGDVLIEEIEAAFEAGGRRVCIKLVEPDELADTIRAHAELPVVVVGGGDATVRLATGILAGRRAALSILPLGQANRFAARCGIPADMAGAVLTAIAGQRRRMDVAQAGGRIFLDQAAFGAGATAFLARDRILGTWRERIAAGWQAIRHGHARSLALSIDTQLCTVRANALIATLSAGEPPMPVRVMDVPAAGPLTVALATRPDRLGRALRALWGSQAGSPPPSVRILRERAEEIIIDGMGPIDASLDGEATTFALPLRIRTLPNALGIVTPREIVRPEQLLLTGAD